jgi:hypothetical protein
VHDELVPQILSRACAVAPKVGWSKELVLAFRTTSHSGSFAVVPQDDEAALWHDEDSVAHSQEMRHRAAGQSEESWKDAWCVTWKRRSLPKWLLQINQTLTNLCGERHV